jgi:cytochrome P450
VVDFDIYNPPGAEKDFFAAWQHLQGPEKPAAVWSPYNGGHWILTRGDDIQALIGNPEYLANDVLAAPAALGEITRFIPLQLDPPEHAIYRSAVVKGFGAKFILALEPAIVALARELIGGFKSRGSCEFVEEFAEILPVSVFLMLVGLPTSDQKMLRKLGTQLTRPDGTMTFQQLIAAADAYLAPYITVRMSSPGEDLFSRILAVPLNGRPWTRDEAERLCRNLLFGGLDTVVAMVGFTAWWLATHPIERAQLRADPKLISIAADELLRRYGSVSVGRRATVDFDVGDVRIAAGDIVYVPTMLHNLDERYFAEPGVVKLDRVTPRHMTMGGGPHRCVGAALARMELMLFVREWLALIPEFEIAGDVRMKGGAVGAITRLPLRWAVI